jgi:hypothetical protein
VSPILYDVSLIILIEGDLKEKQPSPLQIGRISKTINTPIKKLKKVSKRLSFKISISIILYPSHLNKALPALYLNNTDRNVASS